MSKTGGESHDIIDLSGETQRTVEEAQSHATDLLAAARRLDEYPHLAYHLGVLSLEEVGRSTLLVMNEIASRRQETRRFERDSEDHVRKLFWALWGPSFGRELITGAQIEEFQGLARAIHDTRKMGIYVDPEGVPPRDAVTAEGGVAAPVRRGATRDFTEPEVGPPRFTTGRRHPLVHGRDS